MIPFADQLPTPAETVDATFSFAGRLLESQHSFLMSLAELSMPAPAPAPATTVTKKA
jgi:hypothetical protein